MTPNFLFASIIISSLLTSSLLIRIYGELPVEW